VRKALFTIISLGLLSSCTSEHESLVQKADREASRQNAQLAKYLYLQVIEQRKERDHIRYSALKGLAKVCLDQLFDYPIAAKSFETIFEEYSGVARYQTEIAKLRLEASKMYRINLERPQKALNVLSPFIEGRGFSIEIGKELGWVFVALSDYNQARHWFVQSWERAKARNSCSDMRELQLNIIQVFSLQDLCDEALRWTGEALPKGCEPDAFAILIEKAHCFEISGEVNKAMSLFEEVIAKDAKNERAHFFLEGLKRRQKEKASK